MARNEPSPATRSLRQWPLLIVVIGVAAGLAVTLIAPTSWRLGCLIIGAAIAIGGIERIALPNREAGLLQVRGKIFDVAVLILTAGAIIALAILVPSGR